MPSRSEKARYASMVVNSGLCVRSMPSLRKMRPISNTRSKPPTMQALEVQLGSDAQVVLLVQRIEVRDERFGRGTALNGL